MLCNAIEIKTENLEVEHIRQQITKALSILSVHPLLLAIKKPSHRPALKARRHSMSAVATMRRLQAIYVLDTFVLSSNSVCFVYIISFFPG